MSSVCPACGVAVVTGYVRCPRCHAGLAQGAGRPRRAVVDPGGTVLQPRRLPRPVVIAALGVASVAAILLVAGLHLGREQTTPPIPPAIEAKRPSLPAGVPPPLAAPAPTRARAEPVQDPAGLVSDLEGALRRQRLWGRVVITGQRLDIRSGACADPAMQPLIDDKRRLLRGAGLTKLRCLAQSGAVVFDRDL